MDEEPLCKIGDSFYTIYRGKVIPVKIKKVTKHSLGHISYQDDLRYDHCFNSSFCNRYFTRQDIAEEVIKHKKEITLLRDEIANKEAEVRFLLQENERQIIIESEG